MISIRSIFRRLPSVTYSRGQYHVHGSDLELWRMATAVMLALEQRGYDGAVQAAYVRRKLPDGKDEQTGG